MLCSFQSYAIFMSSDRYIFSLLWSLFLVANKHELSYITWQRTETKFRGEVRLEFEEYRDRDTNSLQITTPTTTNAITILASYIVFRARQWTRFIIYTPIRNVYLALFGLWTVRHDDNLIWLTQFHFPVSILGFKKLKYSSKSKVILYLHFVKEA